MRKSKSSRYLWSILVVSLAGCVDNSGLAPVTGVITLDGKPLEKAGVMFHPDAGGVPAAGETDADGKFTLSTRVPGDGASIGNNVMTVAKAGHANPGAAVEEGEIVAMKLLTPLKYGNPKTSGLTIEVKRGMEPVKIDLVSGK